MRTRRPGAGSRTNGIRFSEKDHAPAAHLRPKVLARESRALHEGAELEPRHLGMNGAKTHKCSEAAIGAGDNALAADETGVALDPLGDEFRMLEHIRLGVDNARDDDLVGRK